MENEVFLTSVSHVSLHMTNTVDPFLPERPYRGPVTDSPGLSQAKHSGNKETIRRGALMKMLQNTAQTLPLWVGPPGEEPPELCGAVQADPSYAAKVRRR